MSKRLHKKESLLKQNINSHNNTFNPITLYAAQVLRQKHGQEGTGHPQNPPSAPLNCPLIRKSAILLLYTRLQVCASTTLLGSAYGQVSEDTGEADVPV